jgi:hypothetical protein
MASEAVCEEHEASVPFEEFVLPGHTWMEKSWVQDGWRYATNGRVAIRARDNASNSEGRLPDIAGIFDGGDWTACDAPLPPANGKTQTLRCSAFHEGTGTCKECDGAGTCECPDCDAMHDCGRCDGTGRVEGELDAEDHPADCQCGGVGTWAAPANQYVEGALFDGRYLDRIRKHLAGVRLLVVMDYKLDSRRSGMMYFVADGGVQGILAGISERAY